MTRRTFPGRFAALVTLAGVGLAAQGLPPARGGGPAQVTVLKAGTGLVMGRVVDGDGKNGVDGAAVTLFGSALGSASSAFSDGVGGGSRQLLTGADGQFLFRDLPKGAYQLTATAPGYVQGTYGRTHPPAPIARVLDISSTLDLADGEKRGDVAISIWKAGTIAGIVTDEAGEPLVQVSVRFFPVLPTWGGLLLSTAGTSANTDDRGVYRGELTPGDYLVVVLGSPTTVPASVADEYRQAQEAGPAASRAYADGASASGMPLGSAGVRIGNLIVARPIGRGGGATLPLPRADGRLFIYPTTYYPSGATSSSATPVTVKSGEERGGIDLQLKPQPTFRVSGIVTEPTGPAGHVGVTLVTADWSKMTSPAIVPDSLQTATEKDGTFTFLGVVPGQYTLRVLKTPPVSRIQSTVSISGPGGGMSITNFVNDPGSSAEPTLWASQTVAVNDDDVGGLNVELRQGGRVSGRVEFDGTSPVPILRNLSISPRPVPGSLGALISVPSNARPDDNREFSTSQVVPGKYLMVVNVVPSGWVLKSAIAGGVDAADIPIDIGAGGMSGMVVTLTDRISKISGTVRDAGGQVPALSEVVVFPVDNTLWPRVGLSSRREKTVSCGRDGRYSMSGFPDGDYLVAAATNTTLDFTDPKILTALTAGAAHVSLAGDAKNADLRAVDVH